MSCLSASVPGYDTRQVRVTGQSTSLSEEAPCRVCGRPTGDGFTQTAYLKRTVFGLPLGTTTRDAGIVCKYHSLAGTSSLEEFYDIPHPEYAAARCRENCVYEFSVAKKDAYAFQILDDYCQRTSVDEADYVQRVASKLATGTTYYLSPEYRAGILTWIVTGVGAMEAPRLHSHLYDLWLTLYYADTPHRSTVPTTMVIG